jgi:starch synthase
MEILSVASEIYPLVKTGGLADVVGALPHALSEEGLRVRTLVPGYPEVLSALEEAEELHGYSEIFGGTARLLAGRARGLDLFVLEAPHLYARGGNPYAGPAGEPWPDNAQRFAALARAGASLGGGLLPSYQPAVVHAHDWQAGLLPAYRHYDSGPGAPTVMTVHNLAYQGQFPADLLSALGLPASSFTIEGVEYYGRIGFLKAGLRFADRITTVSPSYAREIQTDHGGMGLGGLLRARSNVLTGIVNGLDTRVWDPAQDPLLAARFDRHHIAPRARNKLELISQFGLTAEAQGLLFGVVGRLTWHKGHDLILPALPSLLAEDAQLVVLGTGEAGIEAGFRKAMAAHPGRIACLIGYDERLAHLLQGGVDSLLVPSRSEPCGLTQLAALRYGAVPLVARVGGLADTVIDADPAASGKATGTGLQFSPVTLAMLEDAIRRAAALYRDRKFWRQLQANGMQTDVSWRLPGRRYAALFRELAGEQEATTKGRPSSAR